VKRKTPLQRKAPMPRRPPGRKTPPKNRRTPDPGREFWQEQRAKLYDRSGGACERCGADLNATGMEAHHRKLRSQGGGHDLTNLAALCPGCHLHCHRNPVEARMGGWIVPAPCDPAARAVQLWTGRVVRLGVEGDYDVVFDTDEEEPA